VISPGPRPITSAPAPTARAVALAALVLTAVGCDGPAPAPGLPPGLEVVTAEVAAPAGGEAAVILRSARPSRVSLLTAGEGEPLAAGRAEDEPSPLVFTVPSWVGSGSTVELTVVAVSTDGVVETSTVNLLGVGQVTSHELSAGPFLDVAALSGRAFLLSATSVHLVNAMGAVGQDSPPTRPLAVVTDGDSGVALVGGDGSSLWVYVPDDGGPRRDETLALPPYDAVPPQPVGQVRSLHVNGQLLAAATDRGMSIIDRAAGRDDEGEHCRGRSAMTTMLAGTDFGEGMDAVAVTSLERLLAVGGYLNVNEPFDNTDDGTCDSPMPNRGTRVVDTPEGGGTAWGGTSMALSGANLWIGRTEGGLVLVPAEFEPEDNRRIPSDQLVLIESDDLPLPSVQDLAPAGGGAVWAVLQDPVGSTGGIGRISADGVELWIDMASLGGLPIAVDQGPTGEVWVATAVGYAVFTVGL